jgi:hypothetical protein
MWFKNPLLPDIRTENRKTFGTLRNIKLKNKKKEKGNTKHKRIMDSAANNGFNASVP